MLLISVIPGHSLFEVEELLTISSIQPGIHKRKVFSLLGVRGKETAFPLPPTPGPFETLVIGELKRFSLS